MVLNMVLNMVLIMVLKMVLNMECRPELVHHVVCPSLAIGGFKRDELLLTHIHLEIN